MYCHTAIELKMISFQVFSKITKFCMSTSCSRFPKKFLNNTLKYVQKLPLFFKERKVPKSCSFRDGPLFFPRGYRD